MSLCEKAGDRLPLIHRTLHLHLKLRRWSSDIVQILGQLKETAKALGSVTIMLTCGLAEAQTLDQQAKCAAQARIAFTEIETQRRPEQLKYGKDITGTFASYLNQRLNRCFVMIERTYTNFNNNYASETDLTDAISRHGYAFYSDISGKMLTCDLAPPGKARVICSSREEFDAFTAQYME